MTNVEVKNRIVNSEAQIMLLKKAVSTQPDFDIDETNWRKLKPFIKKERAKLYKRVLCA